MTRKEIEDLEYTDTMVEFHSLCEQYGCRKIMQDFSVCFPAMFEELYVQINRVKPEKQIPALFKP